MPPSDVDAVVIGAGAMGAATAWRLAQGGRQVVVLEQFEAGHDRGSSHGASRVFRLAYRDARYVALATRALTLWRELEADAGVVLLEQGGQIDHGDPGAIAEIEANLRAAGRPTERLSADAATERWAGMRFDGAVLVSPDGGRCLADATVAALTRRAADHGAELHFSTPVERIEVDDDLTRSAGARATVHTAVGSWRAPAVVVAAGAWLGSLLGERTSSGRALGLPPLRVTLEQPAHFTPLDPRYRWPSFLHHVEGRRAGNPLGFGAYGVFSPGEGMKVGEHGTGQPIDPAAPRPPIDPARVARLGRYVAQWFPGLDPEPASISGCLYTTTPDEHFVVDRRGPLVICSPCSGHGFKFVPAIGDMAAALALGGTQAEAPWRLGT